MTTRSATKTGDRLLDFPAECGLETRWIEARDGTRLRLLCGGAEKAPRLLCLHGFPQNAAEWRRLLPFVRHRFRVLLLDLRGFGASELARSGAYDMDTLVDDLAIVLESTASEGDGGPAHLCAHDWGGAIAWELARRRPELIRHHVSVNAPHLGAYIRELVSNRMQLKSSWYTLLFQIPLIEHLLAANGASGLVAGLRGSSRPGTFSDEDLELYVGPLRDPKRMRAALSYYRAGSGKLVSVARGKERGERIEVPTTIVWGERDAAIQRSVAERMQRDYCPHAEIRWLRGATHWVPDECPEDVARAVIDGLSQPLGPPATGRS